MKKLNNKGFTLIEMVIVIVIIAILAAMLVPSLLAYVDNANQKSFINACDTIKTSVLTTVTNAYANNVTISKTADMAATSNSAYATAVNDLVGKTIKYGSASTAGADYTASFTMTKNTVSTFVVYNAKYTGTWTTSGWSVSAK